MELNEFINNVADQFENTDRALIGADTEFKKLDEWSSIIAISIVQMVAEEYGVVLKGADVKGVQTIADLYDIVAAKAAE